ncbi:coiled-coil domain-containing protein [Oceanobacillus salinisoli]|uniref:coiled-coil domain-containing protein n=1 Tax=Oceanobacillus salinisoli TaxID=2678611 RepID=UPI0012E24D93|nr:hypothetical protein [Oceanobacillus salinisoli]
MGLYINPNHHNEIYKNDAGLKEPNQGFFVKNHMAEMIEEQKKVNDSLSKSVLGLKKLYEKQEDRQTGKWEALSKQLNELRTMNKQHETLEQEVMEQLKKLEQDNERLTSIVEDNQLSEQQMMKEWNVLVTAQQEIESRMRAFGETSEQIKEKMEQQMKVQRQLTEKMIFQEKSQEEMQGRLDNQEALTEKISRQLEHFRSILYERTNYLSEKIDDMSSYVMNLFSSDPMQSTILMSHHKQNEKENVHK